MIKCDLLKYSLAIKAEITVCALSYRHSPEKHWKVGFYAMSNGENVPIEDVEIEYKDGEDPIKQAYNHLKSLDFISNPIDC